MELFEADFGAIIIRFNLMIAVVVTAFVIGVPFLAILAVPVLLSNMLGIKFRKAKTQETATTQVARELSLDHTQTLAA